MLAFLHFKYCHYNTDYMKPLHQLQWPETSRPSTRLISYAISGILSLFINPANTTDGYTDQIERVTMKLLDLVVTLQVVVHHKFAPGRQLSPEVVAAKCDCRAKERQWKLSVEGSGQTELLRGISQSQHPQGCRNLKKKDQFRKIEDCANDSKRKWAAIKNYLHPKTRQPTSMPDKNKSRATSCASFFRNKVINIGEAISSKLNDVLPNSIWDDNHSAEGLYNLPPVTEDEVQNHLSSMYGKSSSHDFVPTSLLQKCSEAFAPIITRLANLSGRCFKMAQVMLLLTVGLDAIHLIIGQYATSTRSVRCWSTCY